MCPRYVAGTTGPNESLSGAQQSGASGIVVLSMSASTHLAIYELASLVLIHTQLHMHTDTSVLHSSRSNGHISEHTEQKRVTLGIMCLLNQ